MRITRKKNFLDQVVILVGGLGSRLGKLTKKTPKPLLKINNEVFLDILINNFLRFGFSKITLLTSYKSELFFRKYNGKIIGNSKIYCINEGSPKGTGGAIFNAKDQLDDYFLLSNGDTIFDINYHDFFNRSNKSKALNFAITNQRVKNRFSFVNFKKNRVLSFNKKKGSYVNSGYYIVNKKIFFKEKIKKKINEKISLENEIIINLVKKNQCSIVKFKKPFIDIGVKNDLKKTFAFLKKFYTKKFVILDRDGVINYDYGYVNKTADFRLKPKIVETIKYLNNNNYFVFVVTNQSGIGRGYYSEESVLSLHRFFNEFLKERGSYIEDFFIAPYYQNAVNKKYLKGSYLRKPNIGLFKKIQKKYNVSISGSYMIGDQDTDRQFAHNCGIKFYDIKKYKNIYNLVKKASQTT